MPYHWTMPEHRRLCDLAADNAAKAVILAALPGRSWDAIRLHGRRHGVWVRKDGRPENQTYPRTLPIIRELVARRRARGMSREVLAKIIDVHPKHLGHMERGQCMTTIGTLLAWGEALGMVLTWRSTAN